MISDKEKISDYWRTLKILCDQIIVLENGDIGELLKNTELEKIIKWKQNISQIRNLKKILSDYLDKLAKSNIKEKNPVKAGFPPDSIAIYIPIARRLIRDWEPILSDQRIEDLIKQRDRQKNIID